MRPVDIPGGKFKVDWSGNPGPAPMLQWIKVSDLVIDDDYQRDLGRGNWAIIRRIASRFSWSMFSPVFVAPVEGGKYAIIDGQHRVHAAHLCGFEEVPCQIVQMTKDEQAKAFAAVNGSVTKVTVWNILRAELASGADWAVNLREVVEGCRCVLAVSNKSANAKQVGEIFAVGGMRKLMDRFGADALGDALLLVRNGLNWREDPQMWRGSIIIPTLGALCQRPSATVRPDFPAAFDDLDVAGISDRVRTIQLERKRKGLPSFGSSEIFETEVLSWIDKTFPQRIGVAK